MTTHNEAMAAAKQELAEAQAWLLDIPVDCQPLDIVERQAITNYWPARIAKLVEIRNDRTRERS